MKVYIFTALVVALAVVVADIVVNDSSSEITGNWRNPKVVCNGSKLCCTAEYRCSMFGYFCYLAPTTLLLARDCVRPYEPIWPKPPKE